MPPKTPAPAQDSSQPIGTPPGGGSWTWSAEQGWVPLTPASPPAPTETPQE